MKLTFLITSILLIPSLSLGQKPVPLVDPEITGILHEALSGEIAKDHVIQITRHHRIQGSRGYRDAAQYVLQQLRGYGYSEQDAYIESFTSDGKASYQTWQSPSGWDIESAELRMVEPYEERITGFPEIAMSVVTYSNPGDTTAELVWVGQGTSDADYEGKDVRGKFLLATGYGGSVHRLGVLKYGARAVVCYLDDERASEYPDMLQYTGMWPRTDELTRVSFGFNLSNRQGEKLRQLLAGGKKVVLHGRVTGTGLEPYFMDVVVAHIRGGELAQEELVFSAHLDHPKESANDNASGSGAILDIARALKGLITEGRLEKPKRSFRFIWIPEWYGTMAYIDAHPELAGPELGGKFLANMNLDMVGEHTELLHSKLIMTRTPGSLPSVVNDVVENMAMVVDGMNVRTPRGSLSAFNYRVTPYNGGSDHMMFIDRKVPGIMFSHDPDYTHHTSEDTPDKVDPVELERSEIIAASSLWYLANLEPSQAVDLLYLSHANAAARLGLSARRAERYITESENILDQSLDEQLSALSSILRFSQSDHVAEVLPLLQKQLRRQHEMLMQGVTSGISARGIHANKPSTRKLVKDERVPVRLTRGPLDFGLPESKLPDSSKAWYNSPAFTLHDDARFELVNFIDGKRTVSNIRDALVLQFEPTELAVVTRYLNDLVSVGVVRWK